MSIGGLIRRNVYWLNDYFKGQPVGSRFNEIKTILNNYEYGKKKQKQHLINIISHAVNNSEYYKQFQNKSFNLFPVVNKQILREKFNLVQVDVKKIPGQKGSVHIQYTSGSTGMPFAIPQDTRKRNRRIAELKYFGEIAGFKSHECLAQLKVWKRGYNKSKFQIFKENIYPVDCTRIDDGILQDFCNLVERKKITALYGYPNWFERLVEFLERKSIRLNTIKIVIAISEMLQPDTRKKLSKLLDCKVYSRYSNEEQGILGQDKFNDEHFHLNHASYFFEFLKLDSDEKAAPGELCRIVISDLFNYSFPLIRYDTGDTGVYYYNESFSAEYPVLSKIYGRLIDLVYDTKGIPIHPSVFSFILINYGEIILWQFIQKDFNNYLLKLKLSGDMNLYECKSELKNILGKDANITIELVNNIPVLPSGKMKTVICDLKR